MVARPCRGSALRRRTSGRELLETLHAQQRSLAEFVNTFRERVREGLSAEADLRKFEAEHQRLAHQITGTGIAALLLAC